MNDLLRSISSKSWRKSKDIELDSLRASAGDGASSIKSDAHFDVEAGGGSRPDDDLNAFFKKEQRIRSEIANMQRAIVKLRGMNEEGKTLTTGKAIKDHGRRMEEEMKGVRLIAGSIKSMLTDLVNDNKASCHKPGCGKGTPTFKTRQNVTDDLRCKLEDRRKEFQALVDKINDDEREMTKRRYITVTGETPDEATIDKLNTPEDRERFLRAAVEGQGKAALNDFLMEMEERSQGVQGVIKDLLSLQEMFLDMSVMVEAQGKLLESIDSNINKAENTVNAGVIALEAARKHQVSTRKWYCYAFIIGIIIAGVLTLIIYISLK